MMMSALRTATLRSTATAVRPSVVLQQRLPAINSVRHYHEKVSRKGQHSVLVQNTPSLTI